MTVTKEELEYYANIMLDQLTYGHRGALKAMLGTTTDRFYTESGSYVEKIYFTAIDEDKHSFTISPNHRLHIQEVTK